MWMSTIVVVVIVLVVTGLGVAQPSTQTTNTPLKYYCGSYYPMSTTVFFTNRNSTYSQLRSQLSKTGVYYARAEDMVNGDAVYGVAQCRNYLASSECLACFDVAVSALEPCGSANGAHVFLDNCYLSVATPRTPDVYIASTRQLTSGVNATVYAIAQCVENASQAICKNCLSQAYNKLYSCVPASEGRAINVECFMRYSEFPFFQNNQTINLVPFLGTGHSSKSRTIIGVSSSVGLIFLILALFLSFRRWIKSKAVGKGTRCYSYQDLKLATNNFSDEYLIGRGGFAQVFKATIEGGIAVAVKKINVGSRAKKDFENEVNLISNVRHRNLILQLGWCIHGTRLLLVLEYMPHGSLDKFLWGEKKGTLNWKQRCDIILGIARGLVHLHSESHVKIVHRDIKSSNILLDDDFQPKIADFGLARLYLEDQTHVSTRFAGTMGYTSPEYATRGHLSEKVDTYSFGIVALEVISGQSCSDVKYSGPRMEYLLEHAWQLYEKGIHNKLVDEAIDPNEYLEENVMNIIEIALMCTQLAALRPTMSEVYLMLSSEPKLEQRQMSNPTFIDAHRRIYKVGS
ncbi:putative protein kinase RLK-Pelle-DLSV family [Helianthus annuus]|nr:putative protein kinase RLK-Pelle-DLSV family [Helianthus annuus]